MQFGLAQIVRTGWYRETHVKDLEQHARRALLTSRAPLVRLRVDLANQIGGKGGGGVVRLSLPAAPRTGSAVA